MSTQFWEINPATRGIGVARRSGHTIDEAFLLMDPGPLPSAQSFSWTWSTVRENLTDWVFSSDGTLPLSERARDILQEHLGPQDRVQWIPGTLALATGEKLQRWIPHFPETPDILDADHSTIGPSGLPIRWVLSQQKMAGHAVVQPYRGTDCLVVSQAVYDAMRSAGLTGFVSKRARMV